MATTYYYVDARNSGGRGFWCHHQHRTQTAAEACGRRLRREWGKGTFNPAHHVVRVTKHKGGS
jgi:hypothetical protein